MPLRLHPRITRAYVQENREYLFLFGDNMARRGYGGQARAMRGEINALGVPTKWKPTMENCAFFRDSDLGKVYREIAHPFLGALHRLHDGGVVVVPQHGLGSGRAELQQRAPRIFRYIEWWMRELRSASLGP